MRLLAAALTCAMSAAMLGACSQPADIAAQPADMPPGGYASDIGEKQLPPDPGAAPEADARPLAPSYVANTPCADDGPRLPLSGVCASRATAYMEQDSAEPEPPAGCEWAVKETPFADQVLLYRALTCGAKTVELEYAGGAHAAELTYTSSALHPEAVPDPSDPLASHPVIRVATYFKDDAWRLKETIGSDANIAKCEIRSAGAGYPASAKVIAPKTPGADCGLYALSDTADNFWIVRKDWVYAFTLPKGAHDIDPATLTILAPQ